MNYTKRLFITQIQKEEDIQVALLKETFLTQDDKIYIKGNQHLDETDKHRDWVL